MYLGALLISLLVSFSAAADSEVHTIYNVFLFPHPSLYLIIGAQIFVRIKL